MKIEPHYSPQAHNPKFADGLPRLAVRSDAIRLSASLRAVLDQADRLLMIASAYRGEGVSTITAQLGAALAITSREYVLMIDSNLRHPSLHDHFGIVSAPGLTDIVSAGAPFEASIHGTTIPTLFVLPCGKSAAGGATEILQQERYAEMLRLAQQRFRYILLDCAPMLQFPDVVMLAQQVHGAILVLSAQRRTTSEAAEMMRLLQELNTKVLGAVISRT